MGKWDWLSGNMEDGYAVVGWSVGVGCQGVRIADRIGKGGMGVG